MWGTHTTSPNLSTATRLKASRDKTIPARHASFEDRPRNVFLTDRRLIDRDSENRSLMSLFDLKGCWHICASVQNIKRCILGWFFFLDRLQRDNSKMSLWLDEENCSSWTANDRFKSLKSISSSSSNEHADNKTNQNSHCSTTSVQWGRVVSELYN